MASKFAFRQHVEEVAAAFEERGFDVPCRWWLYDSKTIDCSDDVWYLLPAVRDLIRRDLSAIRECDVFVLVSLQQDSTQPPIYFTGANIELGYAMALGKPCVIVGSVPRSGLYYEATHLREGLDQLRDWLSCGMYWGLL